MPSRGRPPAAHPPPPHPPPPHPPLRYLTFTEWYDSASEQGLVAEIVQIHIVPILKCRYYSNNEQKSKWLRVEI